MLETARAHGFKFDAVQMPLNVMDAHYDSFAKQVVPLLVEQDIGVLAMKPMGDPFRPGERRRHSRRMPPLCHELPTGVITAATRCQCSSRHCTRHAAFAAERGSRGSAARPDGARRARRKYELYKTTPSFRWDIPDPQWLG